MELRQLRYFVAVTEEGGFGRAAERLHTVQSAVSRQIGLLERELGLVLFTRTTRRVGLTGAGERLLPEARAVLAAVARTREVAAEVAAGATGVLRLGTVHGPGDRVYRLLEELAVSAPGLRVRPVRLPVTERLAAVRSGELDAALVRARPDAPGLELLPLWRDRLYAALPGGHPLAGAAELDPEQLAHLPLRLAAREGNPPFHDLVAPLAGAPAGPPFTDLLATLTSIGESPLTPSWTVFYEVGPLPRLPRTAIRPLTRPVLTTYLAVLPGPPGPAVRRLLATATATATATASEPGGPHG